ncbi:hypothetical protein [Serratia microhaemolytica]|uniref:hypothetical protein n=1 Tax=Serratia microhaemolytica TaxID=2675110 RepID=UPI000FDCF885|nr:hypothetical protein [Serratia microhaemolytica]
MSDYTKIDAQEVKHKSGYHVFSAGRQYIGYRNGEVFYKIERELGRNPDTNKIHEYIYKLSVFNENMEKVSLPKEELDELIDKIVQAELFLTGFEIEIVEE